MIRPLAAKKSVDIEEFVRWSLQSQKAHVGSSGVAMRATASRDGDDGYQGSVSPSRVHIDASTCVMAIGGLPREQADLVIRFGSCGMRPDWVRRPPKTIIERLVQSRGRYAGLRSIVIEPERREGKKRVTARVGDDPVVAQAEAWRCAATRGDWPYCPLRIVSDPHPEFIAARQRRYVQWWDGLQRLHMVFIDNPESLRDHSTLPPAAPREPWREKNFQFE